MSVTQANVTYEKYTLTGDTYMKLFPLIRAKACLSPHFS